VGTSSGAAQRGRDPWIGARTEPWLDRHLFTIGHGARPLQELLDLLDAFGVRLLADIRSFPRSRHNPQFNAEALAVSLAEHGLRYVHLRSLGGRRRAQENSVNLGFRSVQFRGYADYMLTGTFEAGLAELWALLPLGPIALMCSEAVPWRCHRFLVSDVLTARGARISHIMSRTRAATHRLTSFAQVRGPQVTYPAAEGSQLD